MIPKLVVPRKTAETKLATQIAEGQELLNWPIADSAAEYQQFQDEVRLWKSYSISLVGTFFDTDDVLRGLRFSSTIAMPHSPVPKRWEQSKRETNFFLVSLRSILNTLEHYRRSTSNRGPIVGKPAPEVRMNHTINIHGPNARVNIDSTDNSTNTVSHGNPFEELRKKTESLVAEDVEREEILERLADLEATTDKKSGMEKYQAFIASAHHHMALLGPCLPALEHWVHGLVG